MSPQPRHPPNTGGEKSQRHTHAPPWDLALPLVPSPAQRPTHTRVNIVRCVGKGNADKPPAVPWLPSPAPCQTPARQVQGGKGACKPSIRTPTGPVSPVGPFACKPARQTFSFPARRARRLAYPGLPLGAGGAQAPAAPRRSLGPHQHPSQLVQLSRGVRWYVNVARRAVMVRHSATAFSLVVTIYTPCCASAGAPPLRSGGPWLPPVCTSGGRVHASTYVSTRVTLPTRTVAHICAFHRP